MPLVETRCAICGSIKDFTVLYEKNFTESDLNPDTFSARKLPDRIHYQIVKCNRDGLVRSNPVLDQSSIQKLYEDSKFIYQKEIENLSLTYMEALRHILPKLSKDAAILEAGCGNGFILKALYEIGHSNIFGVEPSIDAVQGSDGYIRERIKTDIMRPGIFPKNTFDLIFFFQTLEHISDPNSFLDICYTLLKPGGYVLAFNHNVGGMQAKILKERSPIIDIGHIYLYGRDTMQKIFEKHNFHVIEVYSPFNVVSLKYLLQLTPIPKSIKVKLSDIKNTFFNALLKQRIRVKLGNLCIIAQKPAQKA